MILQIQKPGLFNDDLMIPNKPATTCGIFL